MDDREKRQAIYMILTAIECYNEDPEGVAAVLEALGEPAKTIARLGSDEQKIQAVAQALVSERRDGIAKAMQNLSIEIEPLDIPEEIGAGAPAAAASSRDASRVRELEEMLDEAHVEIKKISAANRKLTEQNQAYEKALGEAQKKVAELEKRLEKKKDG